MKKELPPSQASEYRWLKQQVDRAQDEAYRRDADNRSKIKLELARTELSAFVRKMRTMGYNI